MDTQDTVMQILRLDLGSVKLRSFEVVLGWWPDGKRELGDDRNSS